jgi:hypothetical protein
VTAGLASDIYQVNNAAGQYVAAVAKALNDAVAFNATLNNANRFNGVSGLVASQGFASADATLLVTSFGDLSNLAQVAYGVTGFQVQIGGGALGPSNFFFSAQKLLGTLPAQA